MGKLSDCENVADCTSQQAFYKLRVAFVSTLNIDSSTIGRDTKLEVLISRNGRISIIKKIRRNLGLKLDFLTPPVWYIALTVIVFLLSLVAFFFNGKIAVSGILLTIVMWKLGSWFGKEFRHETIGDYVQEMTHEHYRDSRRNGNTVNKAEMKSFLDDQMAEFFDLDKASLTREAKFSWAKS